MPIINARAESRQKNLLLALNLLGVVKCDDLDYVYGKVSQKKQMKFWSHLVAQLYTWQRGMCVKYYYELLDYNFY